MHLIGMGGKRSMDIDPPEEFARLYGMRCLCIVHFASIRRATGENAYDTRLLERGFLLCEVMQQCNL